MESDRLERRPSSSNKEPSYPDVKEIARDRRGFLKLLGGIMLVPLAGRSVLGEEAPPLGGDIPANAEKVPLQEGKASRVPMKGGVMPEPEEPVELGGKVAVPQEPDPAQLDGVVGPPEELVPLPGEPPVIDEPDKGPEKDPGKKPPEEPPDLPRTGGVPRPVQPPEKLERQGDR